MLWIGKKTTSTTPKNNIGAYKRSPFSQRTENRDKDKQYYWSMPSFNADLSRQFRRSDTRQSRAGREKPHNSPAAGWLVSAIQSGESRSCSSRVAWRAARAGGRTSNRHGSRRRGPRGKEGVSVGTGARRSAGDALCAAARRLGIFGGSAVSGVGGVGGRRRAADRSRERRSESDSATGPRERERERERAEPVRPARPRHVSDRFASAAK